MVYRIIMAWSVVNLLHGVTGTASSHKSQLCVTNSRYPSAETLKVSLGNQAFDIALPHEELTILRQIDGSKPSSA